MKIAKHITELIGNTPLLQLRKSLKGVESQVYLKLEFFNPGGSVKDRMAQQIINDAEKSGLLKKGYTIIEATGSGNTGIGLAMIAAYRGYKTIFTMPDKNSEEKIQILKAYGSEVIVCPTDVLPNDPKSYYSVAKSLSEKIPKSFYASQYTNSSNPKSHFLTTGPEIWEQTQGKIDYFFAGMGTGGTITGVGKFLKSKNKDIKIIGIDAKGSVYSEYFKSGKIINASKTYLIEGIGEDFIPETIDFSNIYDVVTVSDKDAYQMARRLAKMEGILIGSSGGAAVEGALWYLKNRGIKKSAVSVVLIPDSGRNYISKIYNDEWMETHKMF